MRGAAWALFLFCTAALQGQTSVGFQSDVQPVLAKRCVPCHNAVLSQNGVRFDDRDAALAGGYSGPVIVLGKPEESKLIQRVTSTEKGFMMPPAGPPLSPAEIAVLESWIRAGAPWPASESRPQPPHAPAQPPPASTHWSFRPIARPAPPDVTMRSWIRNPVDRFVLARLEREGIALCPEAPI